MNVRGKLGDIFRSPFAKGLICGITLILIVLFSWRFLILIGGIILLFFVLGDGKRR